MGSSYGKLLFPKWSSWILPHLPTAAFHPRGRPLSSFVHQIKAPQGKTKGSLSLAFPLKTEHGAPQRSRSVQSKSPPRLGTSNNPFEIHILQTVQSFLGTDYISLVPGFSWQCESFFPASLHSYLTQLTQPWLNAQDMYCTSVGMPFTRLQYDDPGAMHYDGPGTQTPISSLSKWPLGHFLEGTPHK